MRVSALALILSVLTIVPAALGQDRPPRGRRSLVERFDANGDGKLSRDELPERMRRIFGRLDADGDGFVTAEEETAFRAARQERGRRGGRGGEARPRTPEPTRADVSYGPHERNVFDFWRAESEAPTPLVIYYHGGGFRGGDKRSLSPALLQGLLEKGVSVAAANYRLTDVAPFPAQMHDCARALQFLRANAKEYGIDPSRVGATGGSAGAGISLWLAFHDDLADPESEDPVARESTRISTAVVYSAQSSYDPRFIQELFHTSEVHPALIAFFGMEGPEDVEKEEFFPLFEEASPIHHATKDDPPVYLFYPQANTPLPENSSGGAHIHHPKFGMVLKEKLDELGVECVVRLREDVEGRGAPTAEYVEFFLEKFGMAAPDATGPEKDE